MSVLSGKVAVVTGAGAGLGRAAALAFADAGACVVANDRDEVGLHETAAAIEASGGRVATSIGDVSCKSDVNAMVTTACEAFGGLDVMHANAAVSIYRDLEDLPERELDEILGINLKGPLLCAQASLPAMKARGGGSIIFVSSVQGFQGLPGCVAYSGTKAALIAAARTLSVEVGRHGIRVNALVPGTIDTPMLQRDLEPMNIAERDEFLQRVRSANSLGRIGRPDEVAQAALFLASDASSYVTGSAITVDGGFLAVKSF
jgi:NAD(P)-dependent dehydrogenase (short-subunit alcohol dehydrogenase family)